MCWTERTYSEWQQRLGGRNKLEKGKIRTRIQRKKQMMKRNTQEKRKGLLHVQMICKWEILREEIDISMKKKEKKKTEQSKRRNNRDSQRANEMNYWWKMGSDSYDRYRMMDSGEMDYWMHRFWF